MTTREIKASADFDPNKKEDLELLLEMFDRLSPEQKEEVRIGMDLKCHELAQQHLKDIGVSLDPTPKETT